MARVNTAREAHPFIDHSYGHRKLGVDPERIRDARPASGAGHVRAGAGVCVREGRRRNPPRQRAHRGHHQLHQHVEPERDARVSEGAGYDGPDHRPGPRGAQSRPQAPDLESGRCRGVRRPGAHDGARVDGRPGRGALRPAPTATERRAAFGGRCCALPRTDCELGRRGLVGGEARYDATYGPLPLLPPDCLSAVVLQATRGPADGLALGGGRAEARTARSPQAFEDHAPRVADLYGRRIEQCKGVFLAGADDCAGPLPTSRPTSKRPGASSPTNGAPRSTPSSTIPAGRDPRATTGSGSPTWACGGSTSASSPARPQSAHCTAPPGALTTCPRSSPT